MRSFFVFVCFLLFGVSAATAKPVIDPIAQPAAVSCSMPFTSYDWDFNAGNQGFYRIACASAGASAWQWGYTTIIPGAPGRVWGTVLDANYPENAGDGLRSPSFVVTPQSRFVEVYHYFDTEYGYDGCNVSALGTTSQILTPMGGYTVSAISVPTGYYAYCVDGEPGWTGPDATWRVDCFDLFSMMGQPVTLEFDFGSDSSIQARGWYLSRVRVCGTPPQAPCCSYETGACEMMTQETCLAWPGEWKPGSTSCTSGLCPQPIPDGRLAMGDYMNAEPWHDWIGVGPDGRIPIEVCTGTLSGPVEAVEFFYSLDGGATWMFCGADTDGSEPRLNTTDPSVHPVGDGWSAEAVLPIPLPLPLVRFKALVHTSAGIRVVYQEKEVDIAPPSLGSVSIRDWQTTDKDTMGVQMSPNGTDLARIIAYRNRLTPIYVKGIPGIDQHIHSDDHCAPTATAQCFRYFENHGDSSLTAGMSDYDLIGALAEQMQTTPEIGTPVSHWAGGMSAWIEDHGDGYTIRGKKHYQRDGVHTWTIDNWITMRNEIERCQDVMVGVFWEGGGGHAMTLDAIYNDDLPDGNILLGFKDPWTGSTSTGELDTETGMLYSVTGAGMGNNAYVGATAIVCPKEGEVGMGGPGAPVYDGLPSGPPPYHLTISLPETGSYFIYWDLVSGAGHSYRLGRVVTRVAAGATPDHEGPLALGLSACSPNPFATRTEFSCTVPARMMVSLAVFDVTGRRVRTLIDHEVDVGQHKLAWDGTDEEGRSMPSGVYYLTMRAGGGERTRMVALVR
jgi:hypothetical protein